MFPTCVMMLTARRTGPSAVWQWSPLTQQPTTEWPDWCCGSCTIWQYSRCRKLRFEARWFSTVDYRWTWGFRG